MRIVESVLSLRTIAFHTVLDKYWKRLTSFKAVLKTIYSASIIERAVFGLKFTGPDNRIVADYDQKSSTTTKIS